MGAIQSRQRYREVAYEAFENAREIRRDIGGPHIWGAILAYIDGRINAERMIRLCNRIEVCHPQNLLLISLINTNNPEL